MCLKHTNKDSYCNSLVLFCKKPPAAYMSILAHLCGDDGDIEIMSLYIRVARRLRRVLVSFLLPTLTKRG